MRNHVLFLLLICFSCDTLDVVPDEASKINSTALTFFTVATLEVNRTPILNTVEINGAIDQGGCLCLEEIGFFYSNESNALFAEELTFEDLSSSSDIEKVNVPLDNFLSTSSTFKYTFNLPRVDTTYFFRSYAIFHDNSETKNLRRTHLSQETTPVKVTLKDGWYKRELSSDLWERKGGFAVDNATGGIIIGSGCAFPSFCVDDIEAHPFLSFELNNDSIQITQQDDCPRDRRNGTIYNRQDAIAFRINESIYLGTGFINNGVTKDFYSYDPENCSDRANEIETPENFTARTNAIGLAIGQYGYIGLGRERSRATALDDIWRFNPVGETLEEKWCQLTIEGDISKLKRSGAIALVSEDGSIILGGGVNEGAQLLNDFWKLTPDPIQCTATIEQLPSPGNGVGEDGIGFIINKTLYVGLGNLNNNFYKFQNQEWIPVNSFPGTSISNGVGFSLDNRGFLFTGTKNDGTLTNLSRDLWIYVPE